MIGILVVSHGALAEGMLDAARMFFGDLPKAAALSLQDDGDADDFCARLAEKISELDDGSGVIILADLFGGTPCNRSARFLSERVRLIAGVNLAMLMETLSARDEEADIEALAAAGRMAIVCPKLPKEAAEDTDF